MLFRRFTIALCLAVSGVVVAQAGGFASLAGTLRTSEGRAIGGAVIVLRQVTGERAFQTVTNEAGGFSIPRLPAGAYDLSVSSRGLNRRLKAIRVAPGKLRASITLSQGGRLAWRQEQPGETENGAAATNGSEPNTGTNGATGGEKLTGKQVSKLPLNGRDFGQLLLLAAGTMTDTNGAANFTQQYAVNGLRGSTAVFAMDSIDATDPEFGGATFDNFNVDAIQEIKSSSGVITAPSKSGSLARQLRSSPPGAGL